MFKFLFLIALQFTPLISFAQGQTAIDVIDNFSKVAEGIYRGGRPRFSVLPLLADEKIKTIINLQGGDADIPFLGWLMKDFEPGERPSMIEREKVLSTDLGFQFFNFPLSSVQNVSAKEEKWIQQILALISDPRNQPVYIHCEHGLDRTGLIVALYRVYDEGWSAKDAHDEMMAMGHGNLGNQILTGAMDRYFRKATKGF